MNPEETSEVETSTESDMIDDATEVASATASQKDTFPIQGIDYI